MLFLMFFFSGGNTSAMQTNAAQPVATPFLFLVSATPLLLLTSYHQYPTNPFVNLRKSNKMFLFLIPSSLLLWLTSYHQYLTSWHQCLAHSNLFLSLRKSNKMLIVFTLSQLLIWWLQTELCSVLSQSEKCNRNLVKFNEIRKI